MPRIYCDCHTYLTTPTWVALRHNLSKRRRRPINTEPVARLQYIRVITRAINLLLAPLPLGLVDPTDPVLHLHDHTPILRDRPREARLIPQALRLLHSQRAIHAVAAIELEGVLVRVHVHLDPGPRGLKARDEAAVCAPIVGTALGTTDKVAVVYVCVRVLSSASLPLRASEI